MPEFSRRTLGDLALCALVIAGSIVMFIGASTLPPPRFEPLGSAAVPRILGGILIVLSVIVAVQAVVARNSESESRPERPAAIPYRGTMVLIALVVYVGALDFGRVPFNVATPLFVLASGLAMSRPTFRHALFFAALGLGVALLLDWILSTFLFIRIG